MGIKTKGEESMKINKGGRPRKAEDEKKIRLHFTLSPEEIGMLDTIADAMGVNKSYAVGLLIREVFNREFPERED